MPGNFTGFANDFVPMQMLVNQVCAAEGVRPIEIGGYQAFAAKIWKTAKVTADPTLTNIVTGFGTDFKARGLTSATLVKIADQVFGLTIVIP